VILTGNNIAKEKRLETSVGRVDGLVGRSFPKAVAPAGRFVEK
jgi:hypothetical protein